MYKFVTKKALKSTAYTKIYGKAYDWLLNDSLRGLLGRRNQTAYIRYIPTDPWPGNAEQGQDILKGIYPFGASIIEEGNVWLWAPSKATQSWFDTMHSFEWLRSLRVVGGDRARYKARNLIADWIDQHEKWDAKSWRTDLVARRLLSWLSFFGFYGASAHQEFQQRVFDSCLKQGRHLERYYQDDLYGYDRIIGLKSLFFLSLCLPESELDPSIVLKKLIDTLEDQLLPDGLHETRNAAYQLELVRHTIDIRNLVGQTDTISLITTAQNLSNLLNKMVGALRFLRQADGAFPLMNGSDLGSPVLIDTVLTHAVNRNKAPRNNDCGGYHKLSIGRTDIFVDAGLSQNDNAEIEKTQRSLYSSLHHGLGSFEFYHAKSRIFVNCGGFTAEPVWHQALSHTAAHNSLSLDNLDIIADNETTNIEIMREESDDKPANDKSIILEISHSGWQKYSQLRHHRRLYLGQQGEDFRGEDRLENAPPQLEFSVRFHLHPDVKASLIQDGYEILLNAGKNNGWRFMAGDYKLILEDSIYMGEPSRPRKTKQIVIHGTTTLDPVCIRWALQKEHS